MIKNVTIGLIAAAASVIAWGASAQQQRPAQPQQPSAAAPQPPAAVKVPLKAAPYQPDWIKVCDEDPVAKKTVCYTTRDFVAENNQPVMGLALYQVKDDPRRFARILVPLTFMIPPGVRLSTEGLNPIAGRFQICSQEGCFVEVELNEAAVNLIKKGKVLRLDMQNQFAQEVNFEVPLDGFSKMYDSAGLDPATLQKMREDAARAQQGAAQPGSDELRRRGEELMRQRQGAQPQ
ncbi:MAG: invasion associated locus B family protein [Rhizobiales bacterium]|nr:invasion associated locus B family protein [Hyphomicrobiales bacterium]